MKTPHVYLTIVSALLAVAALDRPAHAAAPTPIFPKALVPGDTILFIAPAGNLDKKRNKLAKERLEKLGYKVRFPKNLFRKHGYLAGTDEERAAEIMAGFSDPQIDAIFPGTGGYGTTRIVDDLDYDVIRKNPKVLIGFSDITGLHLAINQQTGLVTFHSPNPEYSFGNPDGFNPYAARWFWRALAADKYGDQIGYKIVPKPESGDAAWNPKIFADFPQTEALAPGTARGRIIGGNLSVLHALMGSPYEIETDDKVLFLEDVGEAPYRIDRMLSTLKLAGKFDKVRGVILGAFTRRKDEDPWEDDWSMQDVLRDYFAKLGVPVLANFPVGHVPFNTTLPIGAEAELDATAGTVTILENPVRLRQ
jgi:muramoyltetrapeptide carboxypeptidase